MSPVNSRSRLPRLIGWFAAGVLLLAALGLLFERQRVVDTLLFYQYTPSSNVENITKRLGLTDNAKFMFYASHPSVESSDTFNDFCERQEAGSPILGCYANKRIHIYNVTDERLDGIQDVTAAHEFLHAEYERLSQAEKKRLEPLLERAYKKLANDELKVRMEYYARAQPGEKYNELHSIIPTEFVDIGDELNTYYKQYFTDRPSIVKLHAKVNAQFTQLSKEANALVDRINELAIAVNSNTEKYNSGVASLNQKVIAFNARANQPGGFTTQAEFSAEKAALEAEKAGLDTLRSQINSDITTREQLISQLDAINATAKSLNESIDSVLSDEPKL